MTTETAPTGSSAKPAQSNELTLVGALRANIYPAAPG